MIYLTNSQVRLANQVLQKVVTRYLRRDNLLIESIKRLAALAKHGREALMNGDIDELGYIMLEAWRLHQELDPFCSNEFVDKLFAFAEAYCCGYKLVGAGGGGFALLLAKDASRAQQLKQKLEESSELDVKAYNWNICDRLDPNLPADVPRSLHIPKIRGLLTFDDGRLMPACAEVTSGRAGERIPALGHSILSDQREVVYLPTLRQGTIQIKLSNLDLLQT
ncbi:hypothetical protein BHM03_00037656 [Ensete ventricosum]|nr:hypothetical protein BHM03_00037656 [Ensete ventricosum]